MGIRVFLHRVVWHVYNQLFFLFLIFISDDNWLRNLEIKNTLNCELEMKPNNNTQIEYKKKLTLDVKIPQPIIIQRLEIKIPDSS